MGTRPKVHRSEVSRAIVMIAKRRAQVDDRNRDRLPDSPSSDPRGVLDYLQRFSGINIPRWVLQAEVCDALTLNNWLWWEDRRRELHFLKAGRDRGLFLAQIGAQVGVGKQGVLDRIDRLEALLRYDRPDEKITRSARLSERQARVRRPAEDEWLAARRDEMLSVIAELLYEADRFGLLDEDREWLDELAIDAQTGDFTPATIVILGLAAAELRTTAAILSLESSRPDEVHGVLVRVDGLRCAFAEVGGEAANARRAPSTRSA
jgi:hypothetical protein